MIHSDGSGPDGAPMPGLDALLRASLQDCPDAVLFRDDAEAFSGRRFAALVQAVATQFRGCGLRPGERIVLAMSFDVACLAALFAALRAGLEPALVPCGLKPVELAARAKAAAATALVGPTGCGAWAFGESYLSAAALCEAIRLVATLGPEEVDGALDLSAATLLARPPDGDEPVFGGEAATILTFEGERATPVAHRQSSLFALALGLVDQAVIEPSRPLLTTILPATLAGLVAGPFAALIGAASLTLHGPFEACAFLRALDAEPDIHLVVPAGMAPLLEKAAMLETGGSLILLSRGDAERRSAQPGQRIIIDLWAEDERVVTARRRLDAPAPEVSDGRSDGPPSPLGAALNRARSAVAGG